MASKRVAVYIVVWLVEMVGAGSEKLLVWGGA